MNIKKMKERKIKMKQLTNDEIIKNRVETINQYRVLDYLKKNLNILSFEIFLEEEIEKIDDYELC